MVAAHAAQAPTPRAAADAPTAVGDDLTPVVKTYCVTCHNDRARSGNLSLEGFDVASVAKSAQTADVGEKMIRKLRAKMMPPPANESSGLSTQRDRFAGSEPASVRNRVGGTHGWSSQGSENLLMRQNQSGPPVHSTSRSSAVSIPVVSVVTLSSVCP